MIYIFKMRKLTYKQIKFIDELLSNGFVKVKAALVAYDTKSYKVASRIADANCNNPNIQMKMREILADSDISPDTIAEKIKDGLDSTKTYHTSDGRLIVSNIPDLNLRHKYLVTLMPLIGIYTEKHR
jgi:hypothetical protein